MPSQGIDFQAWPCLFTHLYFGKHGQVTVGMYIVCSGLFHLLNHFLNFGVLGSLDVQMFSTLLPTAATGTPHACAPLAGPPQARGETAPCSPSSEHPAPPRSFVHSHMILFCHRFLRQGMVGKQGLWRQLAWAHIVGVQYVFVNCRVVTKQLLCARNLICYSTPTTTPSSEEFFLLYRGGSSWA